MIKNIKWLLLVSLTFVACNNDDDAVVVNDTSNGLPLTAGTADFSTYVSVGNSLTAGFSDNALFLEGQANSYPYLMSKKFSDVGGGEFSIPYMTDNLGGFNSNGMQVAGFGTRLFFNGTAPQNVPGISGTSIADKLTGEFNNMGVPGAKSFHLLSTSYGNPLGLINGTANPYFVRFAKTPNSSILEDAKSQAPTFFSLWIGNNDVLSYATTGGIGINRLGNLDPTTYGSNDITDPTVFAGTYQALVNGLTENGAKGVVANLPNVTSVPYFTTVPTNPIPALPAASAAQLNQLFGAINQITTAIGQPNRFTVLSADDSNPATTEPTNALLILDESLPNLQVQITGVLSPVVGPTTAAYLGSIYGRARHARNTVGNRDYILLPSSTLLGATQAGAPAPFNTLGVSYPLQDGAVLTAAETLEVKTATDAFNASILAIANAKGLAFVDANALLNQVASPAGVSAGVFTVRSTFVTGGGFSLDGVHPSQRGYALIASKFMEAINTTYGSNFSPVSLNNTRILYPLSLP
jgi:lysophospholipase L1-like esterase